MSTRDHFERHILKGDGCWLWTGSLNNKGYGQWGQNGRTRSAHRVAYEFYVGPIPEGLTIDHLCRTRHCVRPDHLEPVTSAENTRRARGDECSNGHAYTPENTKYRKDNGRRICVTCQKATAQKRNVGYGKPGRPSKAARAALEAQRRDEAA